MAASNGGNVEGAVADEKVVTSNGSYTIIGYTDLAGRIAGAASQLYAPTWST
jgi:NAD(P) transhydrogenase subunit alpha